MVLLTIRIGKNTTPDNVTLLSGCILMATSGLLSAIRNSFNSHFSSRIAPQLATSSNSFSQNALAASTAFNGTDFSRSKANDKCRNASS